MSDPADWLSELFEPVGPISIRRMFGGCGVYRDGVMFALVSDNEVFLKADEIIESRFREAGCRPFAYEKNGKPIKMSYWSLPDQALDDGEFLKVWADLAFDAAVRAKKPAKKA